MFSIFVMLPVVVPGLVPVTLLLGCTTLLLVVQQATNSNAGMNERIFLIIRIQIL